MHEGSSTRSDSFNLSLLCSHPACCSATRGANATQSPLLPAASSGPAAVGNSAISGNAERVSTSFLSLPHHVLHYGAA